MRRDFAGREIDGVELKSDAIIFKDAVVNFKDEADKG